MICTVCWGKGWTRGDCHEKVTCPACGGTGKVEQTNEEWLRSLNSEQLVDTLADVYLLGYTHGHNGTDIKSRQEWMEWLKEKHE